MKRIRAIIYVRVSSERQVKEGNGLDSQEKRCRDYAKSMNYQVIAVFREEGESGGLFERTAMKQVLKCLEENDTGDPNDKIVVIFDDLKRFARDVEVHFGLKREIYGRNGKVESPNFKFEDTPEGKFVETVLAATGALEKDQNRRQVIQKMKARLENGYWPFCQPLALRNKMIHPIHGKVIAATEPYASIYKEAIEAYRDGILPTIDEVKLFVNRKYKEHGINREMSFSTATEMLKEILYAGYLEYKNWGVSLRKAKHEGFISLETYNIVQERMLKRSKVWIRRDYNMDFPLRPHVLCAQCGIPLSASWNKGRSIRYPNYFCRGLSCQYRWKVTKKHKIEGEFEDVLVRVKPIDGAVDLTQAVLIEQWEQKKESYLLGKTNFIDEKEEIEGQIDNLMKRIGKTEDETLISVYEEKIKDLIRRKKQIEKQLNTDFYTDHDFGTATEKVFETIKNPLGMWKSDDYQDKRIILFMYFEEKLRYDYNLGFGTAGLAYPIKLMADIESANNGSVEMSGCDPESENY